MKNKVNNARSKKSKKKKRFKLIFFIEVLCIILLIPIVFIYYQLDKTQTADIDNNNISINKFDTKDIDGYRNIAIFGVDSRANELKKNTRSDSIMILSINKKTKDVNLISLYRDTYVNVPDHGYTKLTHAYAYGGPELALSTINQNFDLNIKEFVTVNFSAVANVIDLLGGITLDITKEEFKYVNAYTRDVNRINNSNSPYLSAPGKQTVNGTQATAYSRVRYTSGGDFKRTERQRIVLEKVLEKAKSSSIPTLLSVTNEMLPQIYTSLNSTEILGLAKDVFFYSIKETEGFPYEKVAKTSGGVSYVFPVTLEENVTKLHEKLFKTDNYSPSSNVMEYSKHTQATCGQ